MPEPREHLYRVLRSSWGVHITIVAEATDTPGSEVGATPVGQGIWLRDATPDGLAEDEVRMLSRGLSPLAAAISAAVGGTDRVIVVREVRHNFIDFQIEGLAAAIHGWATAEFGLPQHEISVTYDRVGRRYEFDLPPV